MADQKFQSPVTDSRTELRAQVRDLAERVRRAEAFSRRIQVIELKVLEADNFSEMARVMDRELRREFSANGVHLVVCDHNHELTRLLEADDDSRNLLGKTVIALYEGAVPQTQSGAFTSDAAWVADIPGLPVAVSERFAAAATRFALPLSRRRKTVGCVIVYGDGDVDLALEDAGEFLSRFAAIVAVGLENVLNYERLKQAGLTDPLTAVNNRRFFDQRLREECYRAVRVSEPLAALMVDVDHFKKINDQRGHPAGDRVLKQVASLLSGQMRHSDVLARYGGEEFVLLLPNTPPPVAAEVAERLRRSIAGHRFDIDAGQPLAVTVSIGVAVMGGTDQQEAAPDELVAAADAALYRAKNAGRNRVVVA